MVVGGVGFTLEVLRVREGISLGVRVGKFLILVDLVGLRGVIRLLSGCQELHSLRCY